MGDPYIYVRFHKSQFILKFDILKLYLQLFNSARRSFKEVITVASCVTLTFNSSKSSFSFGLGKQETTKDNHLHDFLTPQYLTESEN